MLDAFILVFKLFFGLDKGPTSDHFQDDNE